MTSAEARPKRVLVVEDEALLLDVVATELEEVGYAVLRAETAEEALRWLRASDPIDLLFTDIRLPGHLDGWRLAEEARALRPSLPVIYATGYSAEQPRQVSDSRFILKPYRPSLIIKTAQDLGVAV